MKINVLCLGDSVHRYELDSDTTIGVNDVNKLFPDTPVDYLVCVDLPSSFTKERLHTIENSPCKKFFAPFDEWNHHSKFEKIKFANGRSNLSKLKDPELVCYSNNSAFVACVMAYKLGATEIVLYGADFTNHPNFKGSSFNRAIEDFRTLYQFFKENKIKMTVPLESMLALFIPSF